MPPVGVAPLVLRVIIAPLGFGRAGGPVGIVERLPFVRMGFQVLLQRRIVRAPCGVVEQPGIEREGSRDVRMVRQKILKGLVTLVLRNVVEPGIVIREAVCLRPSKLNRDRLSRGGRSDRKREQGRAKPLEPHWKETRVSHRDLHRPYARESWIGLAERGQRRAKGPPSGWIKFGLDSYVDPDLLTLRRVKGKDHRNTPCSWCYEEQVASFRNLLGWLSQVRLLSFANLRQ